MSSTHKIEGWTDPAFQMNPGNMSASVTIRANALPGDAPIVAIIGGKALTHDEARAMVDKMIAKVEERRDEGEGDLRQIRNDIRAIAAETLLAP